VTLAIAFVMPFVMLAFVFLLARIEDRHLTTRTRVLSPAARQNENAGPKHEAA
jgi:hypothetical protein